MTCCAAAHDFDARFNYNFDANCLNTATHTRNDNSATTISTNCLPSNGRAWGLGARKSQGETESPTCVLRHGGGGRQPHKGLVRQDRQDNGQLTCTDALTPLRSETWSAQVTKPSAPGIEPRKYTGKLQEIRISDGSQTQSPGSLDEPICASEGKIVGIT